jgi:hypothetical protein
MDARHELTTTGVRRGIALSSYFFAGARIFADRFLANGTGLEAPDGAELVLRRWGPMGC